MISKRMDSLMGLQRGLALSLLSDIARISALSERRHIGIERKSFYGIGLVRDRKKPPLRRIGEASAAKVRTAGGDAGPV